MPSVISLPTPPQKSFRYRPVPLEQFVETRFGPEPIEAKSFGEAPIYARTFAHPVLEAAHLAFEDHVPLSLRPDDFWLLIGQGMAKHITQNAEALRSKFVAHEGALNLVTRRDGFIKGSPSNDWMGVFTELSDAIAEHIGPTQKLFLPQFTTTTTTDRAAAEITLLEAMSPYFKYTVETRCGIPSIRLEGEPSDWKLLHSLTESLGALDPGFSWWIDRILPHLHNIAASFDRPDQNFWQNFFKEKEVSGGSELTGWIVDFFPYLMNEYKGTFARNVGKSSYGFPSYPAFPSGLATAPFLWKYFGEEFKMKFCGGHIGVVWENGYLAPFTGWFIQEVNEELRKKGPPKGPSRRTRRDFDSVDESF